MTVVTSQSDFEKLMVLEKATSLLWLLGRIGG